MPDARLIPSVLIDAAELARMLSVSKPTIWRLREAGKLPPAIALTSQCVRWRRRTGDPATGIEDWIEAGCVMPADLTATDHSARLTAPPH